MKNMSGEELNIKEFYCRGKDNKDVALAMTTASIDVSLYCGTRHSRLLVTDSVDDKRYYELDIAFGDNISSAEMAEQAKENKITITYYEVKIEGRPGVVECHGEVPTLKYHKVDIVFFAKEAYGGHNVAVENNLYGIFMHKFISTIERS